MLHSNANSLVATVIMIVSGCKSVSTNSSGTLEEQLAVSSATADAQAIMISASESSAEVALCAVASIEECQKNPTSRVARSYEDVRFHLHAALSIGYFDRPVIDGREVAKEALTKVEPLISSFVQAIRTARGNELKPNIEELLDRARKQFDSGYFDTFPKSEALNYELTRLVEGMRTNSGDQVLALIPRVKSASTEVDPLFQLLQVYYFDNARVEFEQIAVNMLPYTAGSQSSLKSGKTYFDSGTYLLRDLQKLNPPYRVCFPANASGQGRTLQVGLTEVTQEQWVRVMGYNPSRFDRDCTSAAKINGISVCADLPVESVSRNEVGLFIEGLNRRLGLSIDDPKAYRLPTHVEWGYIAGAGSKEPYSYAQNADEANPSLTNFDCRQRFTLKSADGKTPNWVRDASIPAFSSCKYSGKTQLVKSSCGSEVNRFGLCHVLGNVSEWVSDEAQFQFSADAYKRSYGELLGTSNGLYRGGGFEDHEGRVRTASGAAAYRWQKLSNTGFRVVSGTSPMGQSFVDDSCGQ